MKFQQFMEESLIMETYHRYHSVFGPMNKDLKLSGTNLQDALVLLAIFFEQGSGAYPGELARTLKLSPDQVSQSLTRLESLQWVTRQLDKHDKRKRLSKITSKGRSRATQLIPIFEGFEKKLEDH